MRVINKLSGDVHPNIVQVLRIGEIIGSPYYFIDMELCDINLEQYIYSNPSAAESFPHLVREAPSAVQASQVWNVMKQIARGLTFIHGHNEVHRDLKPHNGNVFMYFGSFVFSAIYEEKCCLETGRFRSYL